MSSMVSVGQRFQVDPGARLAQLDSPGCEAYAAEGSEPGGAPLFALVCGPELPPRLDYFTSLARIEKLPLLAPLAWTVAAWPTLGKERYILVFEQPGGARVLPAPDAKIKPLREEDIFRKVVRPLFPVLEDLSVRSIPHRAIRADNLFYGGDANAGAVLGECFSAPAGYHQPLIYETLENAMASRAGRAMGELSDDLYALGVLLAVLLAGGNPCAGMTDEQIIAAKIEKGSYATLIGNSRTSLAMMEPLRGLLCDDPDSRWRIADLQLWLDGRKLTPQQAPLPTKTARAFEFAGRPYQDLRSLAFAMSRNWAEATKVIKGQELAKWVKRSLPDKELAGELYNRLAAVQIASQRSSNHEILANVLIAFDPPAPIRFPDFASVPEALGQALAIDFRKPNTVEIFTSIITARLPNFWLEAQAHTRSEFVQLKKTLEMAAFNLQRTGWGFGAERCVYEYNQGWPCRSPLFDSFIVADIDRLLPALERIAAAGPPEAEPVDRHIAAFCAARLKRIPERALTALGGAQESSEHRIGMLRLLATVQHLTASPPLPALARWFVRLLSPVVESFHSRPYRQDLALQIQNAAEKGDLTLLLTLVDNIADKQTDEQDYAQARTLYAKGAREIRWLEAGGLTNARQVARGSGQATVLLSAVLAGTTLVILTLLYVSTM